MDKFEKEYQLWTYNDGGYTFKEFDTLEELLLAERYTTQFYITKRVDFKVEEEDI